MKHLKYVFLFLLFSLIGCASTSLTSFKDPYYEQTEFKKILIIANTNDLDDKYKLETRMVKAFTYAGIYAIESYKLFPPTRDFTNEEKAEITLKNEIDACLLIDVGETGVKEVYIPQTGSTTKTKGNVSTTTHYGGYNVNKPWAEFETVLFDVSNGQKAWIAKSFTGGNAYANKRTVIGSFCDGVVDKLLSDKLLLKTIETPY